jgi:OHCU decarboxylase
LLPARQAETELLKCCGCNEWAQRLIAQRPFESTDDLVSKADRVWRSLEPRQWLEAFDSHPKIGEKQAARATAAEAQKWSTDEQSGILNSAPDTIVTLAELNRQYQEKFGYIFIVCASGKSSEEMMSILRARLENLPDDELRIAAAEQAKITALRLEKLVRT